MATENETWFWIRVKDDTQAGIKSAKENIKKGASDIKKSTSALVSEQAGRGLSQFNEKTEKMRQLIVATGGAFSQTAGQATYYMGTMSAVIGRFNVWELAIFGVGIALGFLGDQILGVRDATDEAKRASQTHEDHLRGLREELSKNLLLIHGMSSAEANLLEAQRKQREADKSYKTWVLTYEGTRKKEDNIKMIEWEKRLELATLELRVAQQRFQLSKKRKELKPPKPTKLPKVKELKDTLKAEALAEMGARVESNKRMQALRDEMEQEEKARIDRRWEKMQAESRTFRKHNEELVKIAQEKARQEDRIDAEQAAKKEQMAKERMELAQMGAEALVGFAQVLAQGSRAAIAETLKGMAIEALARSAFHGIMALASSWWNPGEAGRHIAAAAAFAGFAATYGAGAGLASAGVSKGSAAAAGGGGVTGSARSEFGGKSRGGEQGGGATNIFYINGHQINTSSEYNRVFAAGTKSYNDQQNPGRKRRSFQGSR